MNTNESKIYKREYTHPTVEKIALDNEISLQLESNPDTPNSGDEVYNKPDYMNNDPFKSMNA